MNEDQPISESESSGLDWQAFRYLSNEMSPDEIVDFETLLAEDQKAREALAGAVELTQAIAACETQQAKSQVSGPVVSVAGSGSSAWLTRSLWLAIGATAAMVLVMVYRAGGVANLSWTGPDDQESLAVVEQKALLWTQIHSELAEQDAESALSDESPLLASSDLEMIDFDGAPSWMTAAVLGLRDQDSENELQEN